MKIAQPRFDTSTRLFRVGLSLAVAWVIGFTAYGMFTGAFRGIAADYWNARAEAICAEEGR